MGYGVNTMKRYQILIIILLIAALLPFCYVCLYALPYADDFCAAWETLQGKTLLTSIAEQYLYWNGRYASNILYMLNPTPTGSLALYSLCTLAYLLITPFSFFALAIQVIKQVMPAVIASLVLTLLYVNYMPNIADGLYWHPGAVTYHLGAMLSIMQAALFIRLYKAHSKNIALIILSMAMLVVAVGFNEAGAMLIPLLYLAAFVVKYNSAATSRNLMALHVVVALTAAAFVVFSPGHATRLNEFNGNYRFFYSAFYAALQTVRFGGIWVLNYPLIACSLLAVAYADKLGATIIARVDWRIAMVGALACIFMAAFIPYFGTGILGQHRTVNYVYPFFLLLWFTAVIAFSLRYNFLLAALQTERAKVMLLLSAILVMLVTGNTLKIWLDIKGGNFAKYKTEYMHRQDDILQHGSIYPLQTIPCTLNITDAKTDSTYWVNRGMKLYYEEHGNIFK